MHSDSSDFFHRRPLSTRPGGIWGLVVSGIGFRETRLKSNFWKLDSRPFPGNQTQVQLLGSPTNTWHLQTEHPYP